MSNHLTAIARWLVSPALPASQRRVAWILLGLAALGWLSPCGIYFDKTIWRDVVEFLEKRMFIL